MKHVMIDLETLGTSSDSVILSIGAVKFDPTTCTLSDNGLHLVLATADQQTKGRHVDQDTVDWWNKQSQEARLSWDIPDRQKLDPRAVLMQFTEWFKGARFIWSHGSVFDVMLMESIMDMYGVTVPWKFWYIRDTRTLYDIAGVGPDRGAGTRHNALDDAIAQAHAVCAGYKALGK